MQKLIKIPRKDIKNNSRFVSRRETGNLAYITNTEADPSHPKSHSKEASEIAVLTALQTMTPEIGGLGTEMKH